MSPTNAGAKGVTVMNIPLDKVFVDESFQRPLKHKRVEHMTDNFDEKLLGVLVVNKRDNGMYSVTDGQHRLEMLNMLGRKNTVCVVFQVDPKDEGKLFVALQRERRDVTPIERHKALVNSGEKMALSIEKATTSVGYTLTGSSVACVSSIRTALDRNWHIENYGKALRTIKAVWPDNPNATKLPVVMGMWLLFERGHLRVTVERATDAFLDLDPRTILRDGKIAEKEDVGMSVMGATAWVLAQQYNKHHKLRGVAKLDKHVFTGIFRIAEGNRRRGKTDPAIDTNTGLAKYE